VPELVLGTAQWGSSYGITNTHGRVDDADLVAMVAEAERCGMTAMDTALAYGDAQVRLAPYSDRFWISTKVSGAEDVAEQVGVCLEQLQVTSLDAVMLHDWDALDDATRGAVVGVLGEMASDGVIARVGVSVYGESGVESAVEVFAAAGVDLGIVQAPANAIDQRLDACAALIALASQGCIVQVRSVFLQGLLTGAGEGAFGSHLDIVAFRTWASRERGGAVGAAIAHVKALPWVSQVVVGAASVDEWAQVCAAWRDVEAQRAPEHLASTDEVLLDPRRW
jgi:aryl-alcohol dehydrogenase-like predicted oxidoreductase